MERLRLFRRGGYREAPRPSPAPPRRRLLGPLRRRLRRAEDRPGFLGATGCLAVALTALLMPGGPVPGGPLLGALGFLPIVILVYGALALYVRELQPGSLRRPTSLALLAAAILLALALVRVGILLAESLHAQSPHLPLRSLLHAAPGALAGVLLAVLFNVRLALAGSLAAGILATFMVGPESPFEFFLYTFAGSLVGALAIAGEQERTAFFRAGALVAAANAAALLGLRLRAGFDPTWVHDLAAAALNGLLVGVLAAGLLPALEYLFDAATDFKLLELANLHHPLLKQLILTAPGTYHHSIVVGTLAEAAAEAVGANALLCRVGAYYHDIGKTRQPAYFVENAGEGVNRHAKLAPHLSTLVVMSHVRAGVELAEAHGLPRAVVDLIPQHHGTRLVGYFYQKAREAADPSLGRVREETYRYAGPRPQTREAAILMLADAVEAAARTLEEPTPARLQGLVQTIVNGVFLDGQLDECDLTLRDLHLIARSFVRVLAGMFHPRVEYPGAPLEPGRRRDDHAPMGPKPGAEDPDRHAVPAKGGRAGPGGGGPGGGRLLPGPDHRLADGGLE